MINESQIREQLGSYITEEQSFEDFEDWLIKQSHNMHLDSSQDAQDLVEDLDLIIYEYLNGNINEERLKSALRPFVEQYEVQISFQGASVRPSVVRRPKDRSKAINAEFRLIPSTA
jgi:hypothetical protein